MIYTPLDSVKVKELKDKIFKAKKKLNKQKAKIAILENKLKIIQIDGK